MVPGLPLHANALPALFPVGTYSLIRTLLKSCKALYELFGQRNVIKIHLSIILSERQRKGVKEGKTEYDFYMTF